MGLLPSNYTGPGLVDLQVNGYAGFDFNGDPAAWTAERLHAVRAGLTRRGVVAVLPTLTTDALPGMIARAARYAELVGADAELSAFFPKLHIEGPFLSPDDGPRGNHPRRHCRTPRELPDFLARLDEAGGGRIAMVTLAPELPGAVGFVGRCVRDGICPAIGHTGASADRIAQAVAAGARIATHLGNGSHQELPRLDNYVQTQLADDRLWASFIADGIHVPFATLKNFLRAKTPARSVLVTDATAAAELGPGRYTLGGEIVEVSADGRAARPGHPNLAGSTLTLDKAVVNVARHCDIPFEQAWAMASTQPATLAGLDEPQTVTVAVTEEGFARRQSP